MVSLLFYSIKILFFTYNGKWIRFKTKSLILAILNQIIILYYKILSKRFLNTICYPSIFLKKYIYTKSIEIFIFSPGTFHLTVQLPRNISPPSPAYFHLCRYCITKCYKFTVLFFFCFIFFLNHSKGKVKQPFHVGLKEYFCYIFLKKI